MPPDNKLFDQLKYIIKIDKFGNKFFYNTAQLLHREDGPAIEYTNGTKCWYRNGLCHREDGPAVEYPDGSCNWYLDGVPLH